MKILQLSSSFRLKIIKIQRITVDLNILDNVKSEPRKEKEELAGIMTCFLLFEFLMYCQ